MSIQKFIVSSDDTLYQAFPDIILLPSGKLICVFLECNHHLDRSYSCFMLTESMDRGRTWSVKRPLTKTYKNWDTARIMLMQNGEIGILANNPYCGRGVPTSTFGHPSMHLWLSKDEGETWIDYSFAPVIGFVPDKLVELVSGRWIITTSLFKSPEKTTKQWLWYSDNKGKDWTGPITIADEKDLSLAEASILVLPDGALVVFLREDSGEGLDCYKAISYNQGEDWEELCRFPLPGCHRPVAGFLKSGKIMITYRFAQGGKGLFGHFTQNFFAALTDIDSVKAKKRSEAWTRIMPIDFDRSPVSDLGYSGWIQFPDGEIYVVSYIVDNLNKAHIRGYSFREEDFLKKYE